MFKAFAAVGVIQVLSILINLARTKIIALLLGPDGVGIISIIDQVAQLVSYLSSISLPLAAVKFMSKSHSEGQEAFINSYSAFIKTLLYLSSAATLLTFFIIVSIPGVLGTELMQYRHYLLIAVFSIPAMVLGGFFNNVFAAAQMPKSASLLTVIIAFVFTVCASIGILVSHIAGFYIGNVIAGLIVSVGCIYYFRTHLSLTIRWRRSSIVNELKKNPAIIPVSLMFFVTTVAYSASYLIARYSILSVYGEYEAGLLHSLIALSMAIGMVLTPVNGLLLVPRVNRSIDADEKIRISVGFLKILVFVLALVSMPIILFPKLTLFVLFSSKFVVVAQFLYLFIIAQCVLQISGVFSSLLIGFDDVKSYALIMCGSHILFAVLAWKLAGPLGYSGIGFALIASSALGLVLQLFRLRMQHRFRLPLSLPLLAIWTVALMVLVALSGAGYEEWALIPALARTGIYLLFVSSLLLFMDKQDRGMIAELLNRFVLRRNPGKTA